MQSSKPFDVLATPPLPCFRGDIDFPYLYTGVDYLGPLHVRNIYMVVKKKIYTNAISLGIVTDASCQFFITRYSTPKLFISDNAKNFAGGLTDYTQSILTNWCYNILEAASWWGGF